MTTGRINQITILWEQQARVSVPRTGIETHVATHHLKVKVHQKQRRLHARLLHDAYWQWAVCRSTKQIILRYYLPPAGIYRQKVRSDFTRCALFHASCLDADCHEAAWRRRRSRICTPSIGTHYRTGIGTTRHGLVQWGYPHSQQSRFKPTYRRNK